MFDLNFIAEPGVQIDNTDASWSFLHKRSQTKTIKSMKQHNIQLNEQFNETTDKSLRNPKTL